MSDVSRQEFEELMDQFNALKKQVEELSAIMLKQARTDRRINQQLEEISDKIKHLTKHT